MNSTSCRPAVTSPVPRPLWDSILRSDPGAVVTQSLTWRDVVIANGSYQDVSLLYEFPSGHRAVLPMVRQRQRPAWAAAAASWPGAWGMGGPICEGGCISPAEATAVLADVARRRSLATEIRLRPGASRSWLSKSLQFRVRESGLRCHVLDLTDGFATVWQDRFRGTARTAIRKAERSGLEVEVDRSGRLPPEFFYLYAKSVKRWATMQNEPAWLTRWRMSRSGPPKVLSSVAEHFGADCAIWMARSEGQAVAAIMVLSHAGYAKYWKGAMHKELAGPVRANELLHRLAIDDACRNGCRFYDMGTSRPGSPLAAFKEKFGAVPLVTHTLRIERLPAYTAGDVSRNLIKRAIGFHDV
ncbi:MAG: hypothetical protein C5B60_05960 [Chloroflexi bacterium]|nr:MAG: hypothetical protein C5B60_05960 [Chloroflexota bacterium]